ncbi:MAG: transketolase family protein, partial [Candidatus Atribacteria bacterium]|nr:transketolase family protein [Candidatus Atribacteria bacterium]
MRKENLREAYGRELVEIAKKNPRIVVLDADLCGSTMTCYMEQEIPQRFFEMGIAEQNMLSVAAGLALVGK